MPFRLHLFGLPSAEPADADAPALPGGAKDLALLAFLTLEPGPHSREELATLLWGDSPDTQARASLRQALHRLNAALGDALRVDRTSVELVEPAECDVLRFLALAETEPAAAAEFEPARFFTGLSMRGAPTFEEWATTTRERLRRKHLEVLTGVARDAMYGWRWREAARWGERWLEAEPLSDEACRLVLEAWYLAGEAGNGIRLFQDFDRRVQEAGGEPSAMLHELKRRVESGSGAAPRRPLTEEWLARGPRLDCSLIGREEQWRGLMQAWATAARGRGQVVLIEGEAGVGKTRLAEEFLRWATAEGATVLRGRGYDPKAGTPFGPVVEALRDGLESPGLAGADPEWLTEVSRLLPELRRRFTALPEPPQQTDATGRWRLFEGVAQAVLALAAECPVVLFIDDVQACDGETCALLHFLVRRWVSAPILLLSTLTLGEPERDAPASRLTRALRIQAHARVVTIGALAREQVEAMITEMGRLEGTGGGQRFARRVYEVTKGNPFYVTELLKTLFAQGLLAVDVKTGAWKSGPEAGPDSARALPMPRSVQDAIAERVERLPYDLRDLLATVALAGQGCEPDLLSHVHGISRLRVAALCDELVGKRLLTEAGVVYRPAHPLIAEVVHDGLTASRRREIHRGIALALEQALEQEPGPELPGRIARHAEHGGEPKMAYRHALVACDLALKRYAMEEALSWLDLAAGAAADQAETDEVNRRTARVLEQAGWTEAPDPAKRPSFTTAVLAQGDLDL